MLVEIELPQHPAPLPASFVPSGYRLVWRDEGGDEREVFVDGSTSKAVVEIPKHPGLSVLVYAHYRGGTFVSRPAAAVFPYDLNGTGRLEAAYQQGFVGAVLHQVLFALPSLNSGRLIEDVAARGEGNPWLFDRERVVDRLLAGRFSTIYLAARDRFPVRVSVVPGRYVGDNFLAGIHESEPNGSEPFAPEHTLGGDGGVEGEREVLSLMLPAGYHRFARVDAGRAEVLVFTVVVDEEGGYEVFAR